MSDVIAFVDRHFWSLWWLAVGIWIVRPMVPWTHLSSMIRVIK